MEMSRHHPNNFKKSNSDTRQRTCRQEDEFSSSKLLLPFNGLYTQSSFTDSQQIFHCFKLLAVTGIKISDCFKTLISDC